MTPRECMVCNKSGVKLWRVHGEYFPPFSLYCGQCALEKYYPDKDLTLNADGSHVSTYDWARGELSYEIEWCVPAVETPEGSGWWGITSIPADDWEKWKALPNE